MKKMSWTHFSRGTAVLAVLALLLAAGTPAAAVSADADGVPSEVEVGEEVSATFTVDELFRNPSIEEWTLTGETELTNVTWTVVFYDSTGSKVDQHSHDGDNFSQDGVSADGGVDEIEVRVTGDAPTIEEYTYDPEEEFLFASLTQAREGGNSDEIESWHAHHYTSESKDAREAIESAEAAIDDAGGADTSDAESTLNNAISAYESGNDFDNAVDLAERSEREATDARQTSERNRLLMYAAGGLIGLAAIVGGGYFVYKSRQDGYDKLG